MYKIDNATSTAVMPTPAAPGPNPGSYFTEGNASSGIAATIVTGDWANAVQQEICNAIEGYGLTLSKSDSTQLYQAMQTINRNAPYVNCTSTPPNYAITPTPPATAYFAGMMFVVKFTNANAGACFLNVSGLGNVPIVNKQGLPLVTLDIYAGMIALLVCDGTNFQLTNVETIHEYHFQNNTFTYGTSSSAANTYATTVTPVIGGLVAGMRYLIKFTNANTGAATLNVCSLGDTPIKRQDGTALIAGDIVANMIGYLGYDGTNFVLLNPNQVIRNIIVQTFSSTATYTPSPGMIKCWIEVWGAGGGSGGTAATPVSTAATAGGGGGGGYSAGLFTAETIGASKAVTIGAGGAAGAVSGNGGNGGTSSVGGAMIQATGGLGGGGSGSTAALIATQGVAGGVGSGGSINLTGDCSGPRFSVGGSAVSSNIYGGAGGAGARGAGGAVHAFGNLSSGVAGTIPGGGASGAFSIGSGGGLPGAIGGAGLVIITEFCSR